MRILSTLSAILAMAALTAGCAGTTPPLETAVPQVPLRKSVDNVLSETTMTLFRNDGVEIRIADGGFSFEVAEVSCYLSPELAKATDVGFANIRSADLNEMGCMNTPTNLVVAQTATTYIKEDGGMVVDITAGGTQTICTFRNVEAATTIMATGNLGNSCKEYQT